MRSAVVAAAVGASLCTAAPAIAAVPEPHAYSTPGPQPHGSEVALARPELPPLFASPAGEAIYDCLCEDMDARVVDVRSKIDIRPRRRGDALTARYDFAVETTIHCGPGRRWSNCWGEVIVDEPRGPATIEPTDEADRRIKCLGIYCPGKTSATSDPLTLRVSVARLVLDGQVAIVVPIRHRCWDGEWAVTEARLVFRDARFDPFRSDLDGDGWRYGHGIV